MIDTWRLIRNMGTMFVTSFGGKTLCFIRNAISATCGTPDAANKTAVESLYVSIDVGSHRSVWPWDMNACSAVDLYLAPGSAGRCLPTRCCRRQGTQKIDNDTLPAPNAKVLRRAAGWPVQSRNSLTAHPPSGTWFKAKVCLSRLHSSGDSNQLKLACGETKVLYLRITTGTFRLGTSQATSHVSLASGR